MADDRRAVGAQNRRHGIRLLLRTRRGCTANAGVSISEVLYVYFWAALDERG